MVRRLQETQDYYRSLITTSYSPFASIGNPKGETLEEGPSEKVTVTNSGLPSKKHYLQFRQLVSMGLMLISFKIH